MKILSPPLAVEIRQLFKDAKSVTIVTPWIKNDALQWVLNTDERNDLPDIRVLMIGSVKDFVSGASDIEVVKWLLKAKADLRLIENLHAKIYLADESRAIITSANLTAPGLGFANSNVEIGILLVDDEAISDLKTVIEAWFTQGRKVDAAWLKNMQETIEVASTQEVVKKIQAEERKLQIQGKTLNGQRIRITKPPKSKPTKPVKIGVKLSSDGVTVETILKTIFSSRVECQYALEFFTKALNFLPSDKNFQHIIATTYRYDEKKLTLNIGNWEIVCFRRQRKQLLATFCVDMELLSNPQDVIGFIRSSKLSPRWSEDGVYGFIQLEYIPPFKPRDDVFFDAWRNTILHAAKVFGDWKASSYMRHHRQDILDLFLADKDTLSEILDNVYK